MYMLHNGPYRVQTQPTARWRRWTAGYGIVLKVMLIACVTTVFFQLTTYLLSLSSSDWVQMLVLALWACGLIPLVYGLWQLDLQPHWLPFGTVRKGPQHNRD